MELDELQVARLRAGGQRQRQSVAVRIRRIAGLGEQSTDAASGQHHCAAVQRLTGTVGTGDANAADLAVAQHQAIDIHASMPFDMAGAPRSGDQRLHHLRTGGVAAGVDDARTVVAAFAAELQAAVRFTVEGHADRLQPAHRIAGGGGQQVDDGRIVVEAAGHAGIARMRLRHVAGADGRGDAALRQRAGGTTDT